MNVVRVHFDLDVDDGFPPISAEIMNGKIISEGIIEIDNTPFFVQGIAAGDRVSCQPFGDDRNFRFVSLLEASGSAAISVIFVRPECADSIYSDIREWGLYCEYGEFPEYNMLAISIDGAEKFRELVDYLQDKEDAGDISYAELCLPGELSR
jgi:Domain of unknown function (DUF4265)